MIAQRNRSLGARPPRVGYYVITYKIKGILYTDKWDNNIRPSFVLDSLRKRGATDIAMTKY